MTLNGNKATGSSADLTFSQLVVGLTRDITGLIRDEIELAKAEIRKALKAAAAGGGMFAGALFLLILAIIMLSGAAAYGIMALGLHVAWAFLIVGGAYLLIAAILVAIGIKQVKKVGPPKKAIASTKESVAAIKGDR